MIICPRCNSEMTQVGARYICNNDNCGYITFPGQEAWYEVISKNEKLWNQNVMNKAPSIIAFEYESLYEMMRDGKLSGVRLKIRDVFEVILKFAVLVILSQAFNIDSVKTKKDYNVKPNYKRDQNNFYNAVFKLIDRQPSLGTWKGIADDILSIDNVEPLAIVKLLKDIVEIYDNNKITHWRNEKIGHGASTPVESENLRIDTRKKIDIIADHFNRNEELYCSMQLFLKNRTEVFKLAGSKRARNINFPGNNLYLEFNNKKYILLPLIRNINGDVFFFDSYVKYSAAIEYLSYVTNEKTKIKDENVKTVINNINKSIRKTVNVLKAGSSAEQDIYVREQAETIENIVKPDYFTKLTFLSDKLKKLIMNNTKGYYLLQMEDGMGKTTYVKMLDTFGYNQTKLDKNFLHRAYYINSVYSYSKLSFIQALKDALRRSNDKDTLVGDIPEISLDSSDCKRQVAELINTLTVKQKELFGIKKLVFFIDGLDEIPNTGKDTFISLLPDKNDLAEGIFLIFTSRIDDQLKEFSRKILSEIDFDERLLILHDNIDYCEALKDLIKKYTDSDETIGSKILSLSKGKIMNVWPLISAYNHLGEKGLVQAEKGLLGYLLSIYGDNYFQEIMRIIYALILAQTPVTMKVLSHLIGENDITFKQLAYIGELKSIINIDHNTDGYLLSVTRPELIDYVESDDCAEGLDKIKNNWIEDISNLMDSDVEVKDITSNEIIANMIKFTGLINSENEINLNTLITKKSYDGILELFVTKIAADKRSIKSWEYQVLKKFFIAYSEKFLPFTFRNKISLSSFLMSKLLTELSDVTGMIRGELDFTINQLEEFLKCVKDYKVQIVSFFMCPIFGQLAALYSQKDDYVNSKKYFGLTEEALKEKKVSKDFYKNGKTAVYDYLEFEIFAKYTLADAIYDKNRGLNDVALKKLKTIENRYPIIESGAFSKTTGFLSYKLNVTKTMGNIYKHIQVEKALECFNKAEVILNEIKRMGDKTENYRMVECDLLLNKGQCHRKNGDYDEALQCYKNALDEIERFKLNGELYDVNYEPNILKSIGNIYLDKKDFTQALLYYKRAEEIYIKMQEANIQYSKIPYVQLCASISTCYQELGNIKDAKKYYRYSDSTYSDSYAYMSTEEDYYFGNIESIKMYADKNRGNILQDREDSLHLWSWDIGSKKYNVAVLYLGEVYCPRFRRTGRLFDAFINNPKGRKIKGVFVKDSIRFIDLDLIVKRIRQTNLSADIQEKLIALYSETDEDFLFVGYKVGEKMPSFFDKAGYENSRIKDYEHADYLNISWDLEKINNCCSAYLDFLKNMRIN